MTLQHLVRRPAAPGERPPLLVLLHGIGADERDLFGLAGHLDGRFLVVSARAPFEAEPMGYAWFAIDWSALPPRADLAQARESLDRLQRFLGEAAGAYGADPAGVHLLGFSQGASMALAAALARPDLVRSVVAHSGRLLRPLLPAAPARGLDGLPVLLQHGRHDPVVPLAFADEAQGLLRPLGVALTRRDYDLGHEVGADSLRDLAGWLAERLDSPR
ncbi:MAG TPA: alpha/beta hydrolase-fold protein [Anaeromyxobacteraceae bacterium]|nr:alpha/beta hydrolase-fold protein [Anaeromyxobacteraceae bacterium]